jgi:acetolactate synthase I/III small subunit
MTTTYIVQAENRPGVLTRVTDVFRRRAFNIESLTVGHTDAPGESRMTIVVEADQDAARRMEAHLYKLVNVLHVDTVVEQPSVFRDLAMIKVAATRDTRSQVMQLVDVFRARVIDVSPASMIVEITGTEEKIDGFVEVLRPYTVVEMARTGRLAMRRGIVEPAVANREQPRTDNGVAA